MISPFSYIFKALKRDKISFLILFLHPFIKSFFVIFPSFIIKKLTDMFSIIDKTIAINGAIYWIVIYFIVITINFIYWRNYQYIVLIKLFPSLRKNIALDCVSSLINNTKSFFNNHNSGEIAHFLIHLNENTVDLIKLCSDKIIYYLLSFLCIIICLLYYNFYCGCIMAFWLISIAIATFYITQKINIYSTKITLNKASISKFIVDLFNNISLIQVFCKQKNELLLLENQTDILKKNEEEGSWYYFKMCCFYYISFGIMEATSLYILLNQYKSGIISSSDVIFWWTISGSAIMIADSLIDDILQFPKYYYGIKESLSVLKYSDQKEKSKKLNFQFGKIEFKNVYFSFSDKIILENFSLIIEPKEKIALVGFSGNGKTTLLLLLLRMYTPTKGAIYIDDQNIEDIEKESLYSIFSVILQENSILDRSLLENIIYSEENNKINKEKIDAVISFSQLDEFKNNIYKNKKNSKTLSGGQKQRIAIARALYKNAPILLFDEPTSNLDPITEQNIINTISKISKEKTIIMVTHKLSIIKSFKRILVFDKGKIIEEGSHEKLINQNGLYKKLWNLDENN
jgi:ATP-binding cassette subfamily B protein